MKHRPVSTGLSLRPSCRYSVTSRTWAALKAPNAKMVRLAPVMPRSLSRARSSSGAGARAPGHEPGQQHDRGRGRGTGQVTRSVSPARTTARTSSATPAVAERAGNVQAASVPGRIWG